MSTIYHSKPKITKVKGFDISVEQVHIDKANIRLPSGRIVSMSRREHPEFTLNPDMQRRQWKFNMDGPQWAPNINKAIEHMIRHEKIKPNSQSSSQSAP